MSDKTQKNSPDMFGEDPEHDAEFKRELEAAPELSKDCLGASCNGSTFTAVALIGVRGPSGCAGA